ncbi:MAG: HAMP domain-containing protein, partial [Pseudomonadota bacterium]
PRILAVPLLVGALVSAVVVFLLARYLAAPVTRLRRAAEQIADGDLDQRVLPSLGRRRDEIAQLAAAFDHMAARLQTLLGSQRQLLSDVSHELRSPLSRLQVALGLARQRGAQPVDGELDRIEREAERLNELIAQLLSLSRLESGVSESQRETLDLAALLTDVAEDAAFEARAADRDVVLHDVQGVALNGVPLLLHSALENILRNAVRYTAQGTTVDVEMRRCPGSEECVRVQVRDHGPGVPDEVLAHMFEPFVRVEQARDRTRGGHGLGLAIAERAVRLHGGTVSASNAPDGGLVIVVELPCVTNHRV